MAQENGHMKSAQRTAVRYYPTICTLWGKEVWAILTQQADGSWRIVNCLDKEEGCFGLDCAFTTSCGRWPFAVSSTESLPEGDTQGRRPA